MPDQTKPTGALAGATAGKQAAKEATRKTPRSGFSLSQPFDEPVEDIFGAPSKDVAKKFLKQKPGPWVGGPKVTTIGSKPEPESTFEPRTIEGFASQDKPELLFLEPEYRQSTRTMRRQRDPKTLEGAMARVDLVREGKVTMKGTGLDAERDEIQKELVDNMGPDGIHPGVLENVLNRLASKHHPGQDPGYVVAHATKDYGGQATPAGDVRSRDLERDVQKEHERQVIGMETRDTGPATYVASKLGDAAQFFLHEFGGFRPGSLEHTDPAQHEAFAKEFDKSPVGRISNFVTHVAPYFLPVVGQQGLIEGVGMGATRGAAKNGIGGAATGAIEGFFPTSEIKKIGDPNADWVDKTIGVLSLGLGVWAAGHSAVKGYKMFKEAGTERKVVSETAPKIKEKYPELTDAEAKEVAKVFARSYRLVQQVFQAGVQNPTARAKARYGEAVSKLKEHMEATSGRMQDLFDKVTTLRKESSGVEEPVSSGGEPASRSNVEDPASMASAGHLAPESGPHPETLAGTGDIGSTGGQGKSGPVLGMGGREVGDPGAVPGGEPAATGPARTSEELITEFARKGEVTVTPQERESNLLLGLEKLVADNGLQTEVLPDGSFRVFKPQGQPDQPDVTEAGSSPAPSTPEPDAAGTGPLEPAQATAPATPQEEGRSPEPASPKDKAAQPEVTAQDGGQGAAIQPDSGFDPREYKLGFWTKKLLESAKSTPNRPDELRLFPRNGTEGHQIDRLVKDGLAEYDYVTDQMGGHYKLTDRGRQVFESLKPKAEEPAQATQDAAPSGSDASKPEPKARRLDNLGQAKQLHQELSPDGNWGLSPEEYASRKERTLDIETPERQAMRDSLVQTAYGDGAVTRNKTAWIVTGGPASGKSSLIDHLRIAEDNGALLIDPDDFKKALPEFDPSGTGIVHDESSNLAGELQAMAMRHGDNIVVPTLGGDPDRLKARIERLRAHGYTVNGIFVDVDAETAVASNRNRKAKGGHGPDSDDFVREENSNARSTFDVLSNGGTYNEWQKYERSKDGGFRLVARSDEGSPSESGSDAVRQQAGEPGAGGRRDERDDGRDRESAQGQVTDDTGGSEAKPVLGDGGETPPKPPAEAAEGTGKPGADGGGEPPAVSGGTGGDDARPTGGSEGDAPAGGRDSEPGSPDSDDRGGRTEGDSPVATDGSGRGGSTDYRLPTVADPISGTQGGKARDLVAAIKAMRAAKERGYATPEEQAQLIKFPGWGFDGSYLKPGTKNFESKVGQELWSLLDNKQRQAAIMATRNSHYTSVEVVSEIWKALGHLGFKGGHNVLEPSAGTGLFFAAQPGGFEPSDWTMVELEPTTAEVAKLLYPGQTVVNSGYQNVKIPDGKFPLVLSNVPFDAPIADASFFDRFDAQTANALTARSHNYFFAKAVLNTRPGGLIAFISSKGTLDNTQDAVAVREWLATQVEFVGAVRLPNTAFNASANTEVVTDIVFLRRRGHDADPIETAWTKTVPIKLKNADGKVLEYQINEYFAANPKMVIGNNAMIGTMRKADEYTVEAKKHKSLGAQIAEALETLPKDVFKPVDRDPKLDVQGPEPPIGTKPGEVWLDDKKIMRLSPGGTVVELGPKELQRGGVTPPKGKSKTDLNREAFTDYLKVKEALGKVMALQEGTDAELKAAQEQLSKAYTAFRKKHGEFHTATVTSKPATDDAGQPILDDNGEQVVETEVRFPYKPLLWQDTQAVRVFALEVWNPDELKVDKLSDIFTKRTASVNRQVEKVDDAGDALNVSLNMRGFVDMEFMSRLLGKSVDETLKELGDKVYKAPDGSFVDAETYLSGDVRGRLLEAKAALDKGDKSMSRNVADLEKVQPEDVPYENIFAPPGAAWMPTEVGEAFFHSLVGTTRSGYVPFTVTKVGSSWRVNKAAGGMIARENEWAPYHDFGRFAEAVLNDRPLNVYDKVKEGDVERQVLNPDKTAAANHQVQTAIDQFTAWADSKPKVQGLILRNFNDAVNRFRPKQFAGSRLSFPGLSPAVELRKHRVDAVDRGMRDPFNLFWHGVGSGKTFTGIMLAMKLKQTGLRNKPVFVCYKPTLEQIIGDAYKAYPNGNFLAAHQDSFSKGNREEFLALMTTGDWDCVFITQEQLRALPLSTEAVRSTYDAFLNIEMANAGFDSEADAEKASKSRDTKTKELGRRMLKLIAERDKAVAAAEKATSGLTFDSMGIDQLIVDEAHMYKGLTVETSHTSLGLSDSSRALDLYMKLSHLREQNGGATLMTGTAIVNSGAEVFNLIRMLNPKALADLGVSDFDSFASVFVRFGSEVEATVTGAFKQKERIRAFNNIQMLANLVSQAADVVPTAMVSEIKLPRLRDREGNVTDKPIVVVTSPTPGQRRAFAEITTRFRAVQARMKAGDFPKKGEDNYLSLSTMGRLASQDARFFDQSIGPEPGSKIEAVVKEVASIYHEYAADKATQIVFMDFGVPGKDGKFDAYSAIIDGLVAAGVKRSEIVSITEAKTPEQKVKIAARVRSGEVRVLIGSRAKIGVGMNIQDRLIAWHHVALGWNPAMVEQGDGRGIRFGNMWTDRGGVMKFVYINEATYDQVTASATMAKGNVITQFTMALSGKAATVRELEDLVDSEGAASMSEVVAVSTGDKRIVELVNAAKEAHKANAVLVNAERSRTTAESRARGVEAYILQLQGDLEKAEKLARAFEEAGLTKGDLEVVLPGGTPEKATELADKVVDLALRNRFGNIGTVGKATIVSDSTSVMGVWHPAVKIKVPGIYDGVLLFDWPNSEKPKIASFQTKVKNAVTKVMGEPKTIKLNIERATAEAQAFREASQKPLDQEMVDRLSQAQRNTTLLEFETGLTVGQLEKGEVEGFGRQAVTSEPVGKKVQTGEGVATVERVNSAGWLLIDRDGFKSYLTPQAVDYPMVVQQLDPGDVPSHFVPAAEPATAEQATGTGNAGSRADASKIPPEHATTVDFKKRVEDLVRLSKGGLNVQVWLRDNINSDVFGGLFMRGDGKYRYGRIRARNGLSDVQVAQVVAHDLGHAIHAHVTEKRGISRPGQPVAKLRDLFGVDKAKGVAIKRELVELTKAMEGEAEFEADRSYYMKETELFARLMEAKMFHPALVERLAPETDAALLSLAKEFPIVGQFLQVAKDGTLEHTTAVFLPDLRQTFIYNFGRFVGTRAYGEEVLFRARRAKAVEEATALVQSKFKGVKDDPETLMTAMEGTLVTYGDKPVFGTRIRRELDRSDEKFEDEAEALLATDFQEAYETPEGKVVFEKWRVTPTDAETAYESLSDQGKTLVREYTADVAEAKDVFNRELMKATYQIVGDIEGYVHHFFEGKAPRGARLPKLKERKAGARRQRTESEGYVRDPMKATLKVLVDLETEKAWNDFVHRQVAMVMEPLPKGEKPKDGWIAVEGDTVKGIDLEGLRRLVVDGRKVANGKRYQVPKWVYERYVERKLLKDEQQKMAGILASVARYWTANTLVHPGTAVTNFVSGVIQYSAMTTADLWHDILTGDFKMQSVRADVAAALETLTPRGWNAAPDWVFGGNRSNMYHQFMDVEHGDNAVERSLDKLLSGYQGIERFFKKAIVNAHSRKTGLAVDDPEFIKSVNDVVDVWAYDYQNVPLWMAAARQHPLASGLKPYMTYPYKYAKMLTNMVGSAFDPNLPAADRAAKLLALATVLLAVALAKQAMDDGHQVGKLPDNLPEGFREENVSKVNPRGRTYLGHDEEGKEVFLRTAKYPFLNVFDTGYNLTHGDFKGAGEVLRDQLGSVGPYGQIILNAMGWSDEYSQYDPLSARFAKTAASFIPLHRMLRMAAELSDDKERKKGQRPQDWPDVFKEMVPGLRQTLPEQTVKVPLAPGRKQGSRTTQTLPAPRNRRDVLFKEAFGINVKRIDPEWWRNTIEREKENALERAGKDAPKPKHRDTPAEKLRKRFRQKR